MLTRGCTVRIPLWIDYAGISVACDRGGISFLDIAHAATNGLCDVSSYRNWTMKELLRNEVWICVRVMREPEVNGVEIGVAELIISD